MKVKPNVPPISATSKSKTKKQQQRKAHKSKQKKHGVWEAFSDLFASSAEEIKTKNKSEPPPPHYWYHY